MAGRGRLNAFDLLPEAAEDDVVWAMRELGQRKRTQEDIRLEFNDRLAAKGIEGIKSTAFNKQAVRVAAAQRRMHNARALYDSMADELDPADVGRSTMQLGEFLKTLIIELVEEGDENKSPKQAMELSRAYQAVVTAQKTSTEHRQKLEAEIAAQLAKQADKALTVAAREKGISADTVSMIKAQLFGITLPARERP
ncbi:phage protein Gp27 family protein [Methylobacterium sp. sgz302541]|uniref:phage protein Gp27 family protein n=1 Tax=unclassified Methylobacterium TaxID=2615210 RepID=UPI003D33907F